MASLLLAAMVTHGYKCVNESCLVAGRNSWQKIPSSFADIKHLMKIHVGNFGQGQHRENGEKKWLPVPLVLDA